MEKQYLTLVSTAIILLYSCGKNQDILYTYSAPEDIGEGLEVGSLSDHGLDEGKYREMMEAVIADLVKEYILPALLTS